MARVLQISPILSFVLLAFLCLPAGTASAQAIDSGELQRQLDIGVPKVLEKTRTPSVAIAVVLGGHIAVLKAYGNSHLDPRTPAKTDFRYAIGSISKQFTAAAMLLLQQDGKLTLDDPVAKFLPELPKASEVTIRELLSHTAGYRDDLPDNFVPPWMTKPTTPTEVLKRWAYKPPDFDPGTKFQYSNTDYVIAGLIIEKVAGMPLASFYEDRIFRPLEMKSAATLDSVSSNVDVAGYVRYALAPPRPAIAQPSGWLFGGGELVMTAEDLAKWDASLLNESLLNRASYRQLETDTLLKNGSGTDYGLGLRLSYTGGHRKFEHAGEVAGFYAENIQLPDDGDAVAVLTNLEMPTAAREIANDVIDFLLRDTENIATAEVRVRRVLLGLRKGEIDRNQFTPDANAYFDQQVLGDYAASLAKLGNILSISASEPSRRAGERFVSFTVRFDSTTVLLSTAETPDGKFAQFLIQPLE